MSFTDHTKENPGIKPLSIGILMMIYTGIVFFSTMPVYWMMLIFSFGLLILLKRKKAISLRALLNSMQGLSRGVPSRRFSRADTSIRRHLLDFLTKMEKK